MTWYFLFHYGGQDVGTTYLSALVEGTLTRTAKTITRLGAWQIGVGKSDAECALCLQEKYGVRCSTEYYMRVRLNLRVPSNKLKKAIGKMTGLGSTYLFGSLDD